MRADVGIGPYRRDEGAVTPHPTSLTLGHLPLKGKAGGCGGGIGLRADVPQSAPTVKNAVRTRM